MLRLVFALLVNLWLLLLLPLRLLRRSRAAGKSGWVHLIVDGPVSDLPSPKPHWATLIKSRGEKRELNLYRLGKALEELAADPKARGLVVTLRSVGGGASKVRSFREHLRKLRAQGKQVIVHLPHGASLRELGAAAYANAVWLDPAANIAPLGVAAALPYTKDGLSRVGVEAEVLARGRYKTAAEGFVRSSMSDEQKEQLGALLDDLFEDAVSALVEGRSSPDKPLDRGVVEGWIEGSPWAARDALAQGIVDALVSDEEVVHRVLASSQEPSSGQQSAESGSHPTTDRQQGDPPELVKLGAYARRRKVRFVPWRRHDYVGVIDVHGAIVSEARPGGAMAAERPIVEALERARKDRRTRAVVLHIDSRGGSALASSRILRAVQRLRSAKPVVAYFCDVAASGGYMIGVGAQKIVAQPVTLTGSIGVIAAKPVIANLLERLGIRFETVKRGERVDMFSLARSFQPGEREAFERELEVTYDEFVQAVAEGRGRSPEEVRRVAEGRVWSGQAALREGLVDRLGGFDVALEEASALVGGPGRPLEPRSIQGSTWGGAPLGGPGLALVRTVLADSPEAATVYFWDEARLFASGGSRIAAYCDVFLEL